MGVPYSFETPLTGELEGATEATQNPNVPCRLVKFKAANDNAGTVFIGGAGVTVADGSTDVTTGWPLESGEESPWLPFGNVNKTYRICDNAGDDCFYFAMR